MSDIGIRGDIIEKIKSLFSPKKEIILAYLYGSIAKGATHPYSDIDVAILVNDNISEEKYPYGYRAELLTDIMKVLHTNRVDLTILNEAPPFLRFQVIRYGVIIVARSEAERIDFHVKTIAKYNDVKRLLDIQHRYLSMRLKDGTYGKYDRYKTDQKKTG